MVTKHVSAYTTVMGPVILGCDLREVNKSGEENPARNPARNLARNYTPFNCTALVKFAPGTAIRRGVE